jgi:hypothetical protein
VIDVYFEKQYKTIFRHLLRDMDMITSNAIQRTFFIKLGDSTATCFAIDFEGKQYMVTAKHVFQEGYSPDAIGIFHDGEFKTVPVRVVGHSADSSIDVSVFALDFIIPKDMPIDTSASGICYGQDVYFLGFPLGLFAEHGDVLSNYPLPFIKKAIVSNFVVTPSTNKFFLDGINNKGFSGGPVVAIVEGQQKIIGVISGYMHSPSELRDNQSKPIEGYHVQENTGIIVSYGIKHAIDLIEANPIGAVI